MSQNSLQLGVAHTQTRACAHEAACTYQHIKHKHAPHAPVRTQSTTSTLPPSLLCLPFFAELQDSPACVICQPNAKLPHQVEICYCWHGEFVAL